MAQWRAASLALEVNYEALGGLVAYSTSREPTSTTCPDSKRFDSSNPNSVFNNQNFLASGFPLAILPSTIPVDLHFHTPYVQQISLSVEHDLGRNLSLNVAYNSTEGRHINRPINANPVNPALLVADWRNALAAVQAGTASVAPGTPQSAVASATSNPLSVATAAGTAPCGFGPNGPYAAPPRC